MFTTIHLPDRRVGFWLGGLLLIILVTILLTPTVWGRDRLATAVTGESNISIFGYGGATAPADQAQVTLSFGANAVYGPEGTTFTPVDEADVAVVVEALVASGIATATIDVDLFSTNSFFGPSNETKVLFTYDQPAHLNSFFTDLLIKVKEERGPEIQNARVTYLLADCATLETAAWEAALLNAQERAERAAALLGMQVGELTQLAEKSTGTPDQVLSGCAALEAASAATNYPFNAPAARNLASQVEVVVGVAATYAIAP